MQGLKIHGGGGVDAAPLVRAALLGDFTSAEFADVRQQLKADAEALAFATVASLLEHVSGEADIDLVLVAQSRPGQWDGPWIDQLRRQAPLVRTLAVLGSWCEGETRTGTPLPADCRVFWHAFAAWWARQRQALATGRAAAWSYPVGEWQGAVGPPAAPRPKARAKRKGTAIVAAPTRESAESIALALRVGGWSSVWVRPPDLLPDVYGAAVMVYDGGQLDSGELPVIAELRERYGELPVVALADFPMIDRTVAAGLCNAAVLGRPYLVEDLLWAMETATRHVVASAAAARCQRAG